MPQRAGSTLAWSFLALALQYGSALLLLPLLIRTLSAAEVGLWYTFQLAMLLAGTLDFGYQPTFVRNIAYVAGGARRLQQEGLDAEHAVPGQIDWSLMAAIIGVSKHHYRRLSRVVAAVLATFGTAYVLWAARDEALQLRTHVLGAWLVYASGVVVSLRHAALVTILSGLNRIREVQQAQVLSRIVGITVSVFGLTCGLGLTGAAVGVLTSSVCLPVLAMRALNRSTVYASCRKPLEAHDFAAVRAAIGHNARRAGLTSLANLVVLRITSFVASAALPLADFAAYSISLQCFQALQAVARVRFNTSLPAMNALIARGEVRRFKHEYIKSAVLGWVVFAIGSAVLVFCGGALLHLVSGKAALLGSRDLALLSLFFLLEITHGNAMLALTCFNAIPFLRSIWLTAALIVMLSLLSMCTTSLGVTGLIAAQIVANGVYNAWRWPVELRRQLIRHERLAMRADVA